MAHGLFHIETPKRISAAEVVMYHVRDLLLQKKLRPGDKLPSEAEIAQGLGVSRGSVREAMKILSAFGILEIKVGNGTYISEEEKPIAMDPLLFSLILFSPAVKEISEFRLFLELDIIELIILHKDKNKAQREALEENVRELERLRAQKADSITLAQNDLAFHRLLGEACSNRLTKRVYDFCLDYLSHSVEESHRKQENAALAYDVHKRILEAIRSNDLTLAKLAVDDSIDIWAKLVDQTVET